jgi:hypothetical protein
MTNYLVYPKLGSVTLVVDQIDSHQQAVCGLQISQGDVNNPGKAKDVTQYRKVEFTQKPYLNLLSKTFTPSSR